MLIARLETPASWTSSMSRIIRLDFEAQLSELGGFVALLLAISFSIRIIAHIVIIQEVSEWISYTIQLRVTRFEQFDIL